MTFQLPIKALFVCSYSNHRLLFSGLKDYFENPFFISFENINDPLKAFRFKKLENDNTQYLELDYKYKKPLNRLPIPLIWRYMLRVNPVLESAIKNCMPDVIFLGTDNSFMERLTIHLAKKLNIKTAFIPDGWLALAQKPKIKYCIPYLRYYIRYAVRYILERCGFGYLATCMYATGDSDYKFLWGPSSAEIIDNLKHTRSQKIFCGNVRYDKYIYDDEFTRRIKASVCAKLNLSRDRRIVTFFTTNMDQLRGLAFTEQIQISQVKLLLDKLNLHKCQVLIKPHPNERDEKYYVFSDKASVVYHKFNLDSIDLTTVSDICVTNISSTFLEAVILKKLSVVLKTGFRGTQIEEYFPTVKGLINIETEQELSAFLGKIDKNESFYQQLIKQQQAYLPGYYNISGSAAESIIQFLKNELERGKIDG